jgi:SAM-dependent methyltransferase
MNLDALWHDLECGDYAADLPVWRALADEAGGPVLDVGAGTGRVSLDLAGRGASVVALDVEAPLLDALRVRAAGRGVDVQTVTGDARRFAIDRRFALVVVPMQTLQLLGGAEGRAAFLRRALAHLRPGGRVAAAVADALDCFDDEHPLPPPAAVRDVVDVRYATRLLAVTGEDGRAVLHRRREVVGPGDHYASSDLRLALDRVSPDEVAAEAVRVGFAAEPPRSVAETDTHLGCTVVVLRAPDARGMADCRA